MSGVSMSGIRADQGPPIAVPLGFFAVGPLSLLAAGILVLFADSDALGSIWAGENIALVHLGTVGLLMSTMIGALYQILPVVAGAVVAAPRLGHLAHALFVAGAACLVTAQASARPPLFVAATVLITLGLAIFFVPAACAIARSPTRTATVWGIRLALVGLFLVALVGLRMAWARGTTGYTTSWLGWRYAHAHLGLFGWVGCLIASVSWQVVPMFYLAAPMPRWLGPVVLGATAASVLALAAIFVVDLPVAAVPFAALPAALAHWLVEPAAIVRSIRRRRRKRPDPSLRFFWLSSACAPLCLLAGAAAAWLEDPRWPLVYGVLAIAGWAAAVLHGMLTRIVPFLLWLHRCSPLVGLRPVPSTRELYTDRAVRLGFALHSSMLCAGLVAAVTAAPWAWRAFGLGLVATAGNLVTQLVLAVRRAP